MLGWGWGSGYASRYLLEHMLYDRPCQVDPGGRLGSEVTQAGCPASLIYAGLLSYPAVTGKSEATADSPYRTQGLLSSLLLYFMGQTGST